MADWIKMAVKAALVATVSAVLIIILSAITFPPLDLSVFTKGIGFAYAIGEYYFPAFNVLLGIFLPLLGLRILIMGLSLAVITFRWVLKVNE